MNKKEELKKIEEQMKQLEIKKEEVKKAVEEVVPKIKINKSISMIASYIETFLILLLAFIAPIVLLFIDRKHSLTFGLSYSQAMERNLDAVIYLYTVLQGMFVLKTFSKKQEGYAKDVLERSNFGKQLTWITGIFLFGLYLLVSPVLNNFIPYYVTYLSTITWESIFFLVTVGGLYLGNKIIMTTNKKELLELLKNEPKEEEPIE